MPNFPAGLPEEEGYSMSEVTGTFTKAVGKIKDLINYGGPKPEPKGILTKEKHGRGN